jgi:hypothetical protein
MATVALILQGIRGSPAKRRNLGEPEIFRVIFASRPRIRPEVVIQTKLKPVVLGFRVHSGWTAVVAIALERDQPLVLLRGRPHLVRQFSYTFRQPYHSAARLSETQDLRAASDFVGRVRIEAEQLAGQSIRAVRNSLPCDYRISACAVLEAAARQLPALENILASHPLVHTADGQLFRKAIFEAAKHCRIPRVAIPERGLIEAASLQLRISPAAVSARLSALGKGLGPPWSQDEKLATLAAWLAAPRNS